MKEKDFILKLLDNENINNYSEEFDKIDKFLLYRQLEREKREKCKKITQKSKFKADSMKSSLVLDQYKFSGNNSNLINTKNSKKSKTINKMLPSNKTKTELIIPINNDKCNSLEYDFIDYFIKNLSKSQISPYFNEKDMEKENNMLNENKITEISNNLCKLLSEGYNLNSLLYDYFIASQIHDNQDNYFEMPYIINKDSTPNSRNNQLYGTPSIRTNESPSQNVIYFKSDGPINFNQKICNNSYSISPNNNNNENSSGIKVNPKVSNTTVSTGFTMEILPCKTNSKLNTKVVYIIFKI